MDRTNTGHRRTRQAVEEARARLDAAPFLDLVDLASLSTLSPTAVKRAGWRGEFSAVRHGSRVLVPADEARRWLANLATNAARVAQRPELSS
jgi:hypothetical protein